MPWLKGNLHTHTNLSDGDSPPGRRGPLVRRSRVRLLDHLRSQRALPARGAARASCGRRVGPCCLIPGEELSTWWPGPDRTYALHVNGYGTSSVLGNAEGDSVQCVLQKMVDRVVADGGLASVNHPNFWESVHWDRHRCTGKPHFSRALQRPPSRCQRRHRHASRRWKRFGTSSLSQGRVVWGLAVDDAHHFLSFGSDRANPGRGWVDVEAASASPEAILSALGRG